MAKKLLGLSVGEDEEKDVLEKIEKYTKNPKGFFHIVSVNPENVVLAQKLRSFNQVVNKAQIRINDGVGVVVASQILGIKVGPRLSGADLMEKLVFRASRRRLRVALIGGRGNLAEYLASCYNSAHSEAKFIGFQGIKDIKNPKTSELNGTRYLVTQYWISQHGSIAT